MLDFTGPPEDRHAAVTREEVEAVLRRISNADVRVKALESGSRWTDNTRLVDSYRLDRVLLAGDAAHVHTPFGGQGLGLGLVDAANLGWKLAAVIRGEMPADLLDTYTAELAAGGPGRAGEHLGSTRHHAARSASGGDTGADGEPAATR